jgi:hypothetical protein
MITPNTIGLDERIAAKEKRKLAPDVQDMVQVVNRALERGYGGGFDLSCIGRPEPVEAAFILDHIREVLRYWARWPSEHALVMATLWVAHTWFVSTEGLLLFPATPRVLIIAPMQSGKTRMERIMAAMSRTPVGPAVGVVTAPGVRNALKKHKTVFLDEAHRIFLGRRYDLQGILTGGYTPGSVTLNGMGGEDNNENIFGPVCIGAQPKLLESRFSEEIEDLFGRSFIVRPEQVRPCKDQCRKNHEHVPPVPQLDAEFEHNAGNASTMLALWAAAETLEQEKLWNIHAMNPDLSSRGHEISIALCAVADRAPDYSYEEGTEGYLRWAIMAREATCGLLLGTDDGKKTMAEIKASLEKLKERNAR